MLRLAMQLQCSRSQPHRKKVINSGLEIICGENLQVLILVMKAKAKRAQSILKLALSK
jgi:hypothetical protein